MHAIAFEIVPDFIEHRFDALLQDDLPLISAEQVSATSDQGIDVLVFVAKRRIRWQIGKYRCGRVTPARAELRVKFFGNGQQVVAAIAVLWKYERFATNFEIAQPHRYGEDLGLPPRIVDVVLAGDIVSGGHKQST